MSSSKPASIVPSAPADGACLNVFGQTVIERISSDDTNGDYYVFDELTPPGTGVPPHMHSLDDEIVFVIDGDFEVYLDGTVSIVGPGAILNFARGLFHGFRCIGDRPGKTTWVVTPGKYAQALLRAIAAMPPGPPDLEKMEALHAEVGVTMPPPPANWW